MKEFLFELQENITEHCRQLIDFFYLRKFSRQNMNVAVKSLLST